MPLPLNRTNFQCYPRMAGDRNEEVLIVLNGIELCCKYDSGTGSPIMRVLQLGHQAGLFGHPEERERTPLQNVVQASRVMTP